MQTRATFPLLTKN